MLCLIALLCEKALRVRCKPGSSDARMIAVILVTLLISSSVSARDAGGVASLSSVSGLTCDANNERKHSEGGFNAVRSMELREFLVRAAIWDPVCVGEIARWRAAAALKPHDGIEQASVNWVLGLCGGRPQMALDVSSMSGSAFQLGYTGPSAATGGGSDWRFVLVQPLCQGPVDMHAGRAADSVSEDALEQRLAAARLAKYCAQAAADVLEWMGRGDDALRQGDFAVWQRACWEVAMRLGLEPGDPVETWNLQNPCYPWPSDVETWCQGFNDAIFRNDADFDQLASMWLQNLPEAIAIGVSGGVGQGTCRCDTSESGSMLWRGLSQMGDTLARSERAKAMQPDGSLPFRSAVCAPGVGAHMMAGIEWSRDASGPVIELGVGFSGFSGPTQRGAELGSVGSGDLSQGDGKTFEHTETQMMNAIRARASLDFSCCMKEAWDAYESVCSLGDLRALGRKRDASEEDVFPGLVKARWFSSCMHLAAGLGLLPIDASMCAEFLESVESAQEVGTCPSYFL